MLIVNLIQAAFQLAMMASIFLFVSVASGPLSGESERVGPRTVEKWGMEFVLPSWLSENLLSFTGAMAILVVCASAFFLVFSNYYRARFTAQTSYLLSSSILRTFSSRPYSYHLGHNSSALTKKAIGDVNEFVSGVFMPLTDISARAPVVFATVFGMLVIEPAMAIGIGTVFTLYYYFVYTGFRPIWRKFSTETNRLNMVTAKSVYQFLTGIKPIMVQECRLYFLKRYEDAAR